MPVIELDLLVWTQLLKFAKIRPMSMLNAKSTIICECTASVFMGSDTVYIDFFWPGPAPKAGQFFIIKPLRSAVFLGRPISVAAWKAAEGAGGKLRFIVAVRGRGSRELADLKPGEKAELIGPLGNSWAEASAQAGLSLQAASSSQAVPPDKPLALVAGGVGIAPLLAFISENISFDLYAGFRTQSKSEWEAYLSAALPGSQSAEPRKLIIATEDGSLGLKGRIPDFFAPDGYAAVFACGPEPMLKAICARCIASDVPCFVSMEKHMACGVGACLGCRVKTVNGNLCCCTDGPIFNAGELIFDEQ